LFDYKPLGLNKDWSQQYCQQFGRLLSKIGLKAGQRPTAYSLRHTFIDVLKQKEVAESTVADIVGHHHPSMTFGRYGKQTKLKLMLSAVNQFSLQLGGSHE
ncbi:tyrosine-type recombinase/integrase, partial [Vibrio splendidus]